LSAKIAQGGLILTEDQLRALEKAREEKQAHGEIETEYPGYLGYQYTHYVDNIKGVGRIYQQTFIDSYCKTVMGICTTPTAINPLICKLCFERLDGQKPSNQSQHAWLSAL